MSNILFSCSGGGHLYELMQLISGFESRNYFFITEKSHSKLFNKSNALFVPYDSGNCKIWSAFLVLYGMLLTLYILIKSRPSLHISLGSHVSVGPSIICWFFDIHTIHIESFTRVSELSASGKIIYRFTDAFYVQWPELAIKYGKSIYTGSLF